MGVVDWVKARLAARTSWDGAALVAMGVVALMFQPVVHIAAYAAIVWGLWAVLWGEKD